MIQPAKDISRRLHFQSGRQRRTRDHNDGQVERSGGVQFRDGTVTTGVFGNDQLHAMLSHQLGIAGDVKRATRNNDRVLRHRRRRGRFVDQPENVMVLRLRREKCQMHATYGQHDPLRWPVQCVDGGRDIGDLMPTICVGRLPWWSGQRNHRYACRFASRDGVATDLLSERVGRIDNMGNLLISQVADQPVHTAEATNAMLDRLRAWPLNASSVRKCRVDVAFGNHLRQIACLGRAAQDQEVVFHDD